jgi:hypothetical protein
VRMIARMTLVTTMTKATNEGDDEMQN